MPFTKKQAEDMMEEIIKVTVNRALDVF